MRTITVKAEVRVNRNSTITSRMGVDPILLQGFMNELNGYFHETRSIYENLAGVETDQVLMRMIKCTGRVRRRVKNSVGG